jgi:hypothetical protein
VTTRRGRPRKFAGPSRAVTLTLPLNVIEKLRAVHVDLSRAVVQIAQTELTGRAHPPAELATFGRRAVIVVNPSRTLEKRTGVDLVPLPDGRALIAFDQLTSAAAFELTIEDALEDRDLPGPDRQIFEAIAQILRTARRSSNVLLRQRNIIVLESRSGMKISTRPSTGKPRARRR